VWTTPDIIVRTTPAVLLDMDGAPQFQPLPGSSLLYATNTDKDLFLDLATQDHYLLASGRWFAAKDPRSGPWRFVPTDQLPDAFRTIPEGSAKDGALAHIAGTRAAREAVRDTWVPQTAEVDRREASLNVDWNGYPQFVRIPGTDVDHAVNASTTILRIHGRYHALENAVWFESDAPEGPWSVSTQVPSEVNDIPPSSAAYHTRYVYIYDHTPDVVHVGYTPGYLGCYVQGGVVILGTGHYYAPWPGRWRPRPYTWGFGFTYNPWVGWSCGLGWGWNWFYPNWYGWAWGARPWGWGWWGPWGYHPPVVQHNQYHYGPRPSLSGRSGQEAGRPVDSRIRSSGTNLYESREARGVRPGLVARYGVSDRGALPRGSAEPRTSDHFTDRDGTIYRRTDGRLDRLENGRWQAEGSARPQANPGRVATRPATPAARPRPVPPRDIQQDRDRGRQRSDQFNRSYQQRQAPSAPSRSSSPARGAPSPGTRTKGR